MQPRYQLLGAGFLSAWLLPTVYAQSPSEDFQPFAEITGELTYSGTYADSFGSETERVVESFVFVPELQQQEASLDTGADGHDFGMRFSTIWQHRQDYIWSDYGPPIAEAHLWAFELNGEGDAWQSGNVNASVEFELTEWTQVRLAVDMDSVSTVYFKAEVGSLKAESINQGMGHFGTLALDGYFERGAILSPGHYQLVLEGNLSTSQYADWKPYAIDATVRVRFEPGQCPADLNGDGTVDYGDIAIYIQAFLAGC